MQDTKEDRCEKNLKRLKRLITPATSAFTHDARTAGNAAAKVIRIRAAKRKVFNSIVEIYNFNQNQFHSIN